MLKAKDFRKRAWSALKGNWTPMVLITIVVALIEGACSGLSWVGIGAIALLLISGPLSLGVAIATLRVIRGQNVEVKNAFEGFNNFLNAFVLSLVNGILIFLWSLLLIIPGIIKSYSYSMGYYILADNPDMGGNEARKASMKLMRGNKWRLFCLDLSFIGWYLLSILTFGILLLWIEPYHNSARAAFYQDLISDKSGNAQDFNQHDNTNGGNAQNAAANETAKTSDPDMELGTIEKSENKPADEGNAGGEDSPFSADDL